MATRTPTTTPPRLISTYGASSRPTSGGWETISWYFFRISGVALIFLVIFHLLLMHVINDVSVTNYAFVAARYKDPFWRVYDLLLLTLALPHGLNGVRIMCEDYIGSRGWRLAVESTLFLLALTFWLTGTLTIITFQPGQTLAQTLLGLLHH